MEPGQIIKYARNPYKDSYTIYSSTGESFEVTSQQMLSQQYNSYGPNSEYYGSQYMTEIVNQQNRLEQQAQFGSMIPALGLGGLMNQQSASSLPPNKPKKEGFMKAVKDYLEAHKNILFTIVLALLADHFVFGGVFREKIKSAVDKLLDKAHRQIEKNHEQ